MTSYRKRLLASVSLLTFLMATGLSACGGGGESDEEKIESTIEKATFPTNRSDCQKYNTLNWMEQRSGLERGPAERACEKDVPNLVHGEYGAQAVTVTNVEVEDEEATADISYEGGNLDGETLTIALVEERGEWKRDEATGFVNFDSTYFRKRLAKELKKEPSSKPWLSRCTVESMDDPEVEQLLLSSETEVVEEATEECLSARAERRAERAEEAERRAERAEEAERRAERAERRAEEAEQAEQEAEEHAYPQAVQNNILSSCLATSGANFSSCECALEALEENYSVEELQRAEANLASGELRAMIETASAYC